MCILPVQGSSIPTDNPCESCYCNEMDGVMCAMMMCAPCRPPLKNMADGSCCGECRDVTTLPVLGGCVVDGNNYKVGLYILIIPKNKVCLSNEHLP